MQPTYTLGGGGGGEGGGAIASCTGVGPGIFRNITLKKVTFNPNDKRREGSRKDDANTLTEVPKH